MEDVILDLLEERLLSMGIGPEKWQLSNGWGFLKEELPGTSSAVRSEINSRLDARLFGKVRQMYREKLCKTTNSK
ncbi:hypothetical protein [Pseudomonas phage LUZ7]|uniref:Uncharacterized protein n=1 Tax=Pseudomonas phage LUZ7 TaxID=655097 RepID=C8ZKC5_9CAUD|nr:hypothetical protein PP-LUZ7_gp026 [Pseudomonas phage LUZ7]CAZ66167.1 hypothetical protein [Pseudomonas phage LUZ7]